ncbi:hypothetical protein BLNAU_14329 [Blattamonas nauphoetae]|uniref:Uncharacterized protein n=1 Tax=Blattamonas nauphoetae TaxID=2049346 RepID=A0ABQ9XH91_9EUKA|nr:hypothetical protein BLNAU_14329 [Blattamonas nauphoetae]
MDGVEDVLEPLLKPNMKWDCRRDVSDNLRPPCLHTLCLELRHCSAFLNWQSNRLESENEKAVIFRSLVATVKIQPALDDPLEAKAVKFLEYVTPYSSKGADVFLFSLGQTPDESLTDFIQSILVLVSSPNQAIIQAAMRLLLYLIANRSATGRLALVKADLIPQLINTLSPLSLSFAEAENIHTNVMEIIVRSVWLATPYGLRKLEISDDNEQQAVHETVFQQVLLPSENYIVHLCVNHFSIIDDAQSLHFLDLLAQLLQICPHYHPTMESVFQMPIFFTIPSCLTFFERDHSIWTFLDEMIDAQREWNGKGREIRQMWKTMQRLLRMEGIEDVLEETQQNHKIEYFGRWLVDTSIRLSKLLGMNVPEQE